ncbi:MAG: response regulator transcription factor [Polyangiaceae bacterium]
MRTAYADNGASPRGEGPRATTGISTPSKPPIGDGSSGNGDASHQRHNGSGPRSSAPRQVLLIEDDEVSGDMLRTGLQNLSIVCTWVKTVDEARRALEKRTFDAVVTDIMLGPDSPSGLELVKELQPSGAPVLVITAFADMARVKEALNHGATFLLEKPFRAEELSRALASVWEEPKGLGHFVERALDRAELTAKERDVARLLLKGLSTREMAGVTGNTEKTLKHHIASIFHKFGVASRAELFHCIFPT